MNTELKNINFFRIIFTLGILYGHIVMKHMLNDFGSLQFLQDLMKHQSLHYGYMCDMFFIISGFFMFFTFKKTAAFKDLLVNKIARLWPVLIFCLITSFIISEFDIGPWYKYNNILAAFFLTASFKVMATNCNAAWFINVIFWCYILYYSLFKVIKPENKIPITFFITFVAYSIILNKTTSLYSAPAVWQDAITYYLIRGIAGMGLGYLIANWYTTWETPKKITFAQTFLLGAVEGFLLFLLIKWSMIKDIPHYFCILMIIFTALFLLFLAQRGFISRFLNNDIIFKLGKYAFSIYMVQCLMFEVLRKFLWHNPTFGMVNHPVFNIIVSMTSICALGVIVYYLVEKPCAKIIKKIFS